MKLIVTAPSLVYGGKRYAQGEAFEAAPKDAKVLKAIRKAADEPEAPPVRLPPRHVESLPTPVSKVIDVEEGEQTGAAEELADAVEAPPARGYRTRRLKAED